MPHVHSMSETERNDYFAREANDFIRQRPVDSIKLAWAKVLRTWSPRPLSSEFFRTLYVMVALAYSVPFFAMFVLSWVTSPMPATAKLFLAARRFILLWPQCFQWAPCVIEFPQKCRWPWWRQRFFLDRSERPIIRTLFSPAHVANLPES